MGCRCKCLRTSQAQVCNSQPLSHQKLNTEGGIAFAIWGDPFLCFTHYSTPGNELQAPWEKTRLCQQLCKASPSCCLIQPENQVVPKKELTFSLIYYLS
jgi:hypothetical protein